MRIFVILALLLGIAGSGSAQSSGNKIEGKVVHLTKETFVGNVCDLENDSAWVYKGDKPAIVDFYADWCGPCRRLSPILEEIAEEQQEHLVVYKVNVDKESELAAKFGIRSLPTIMFIPLNGVPSVVEGFLPKEELYKAIDTLLFSKEAAE